MSKNYLIIEKMIFFLIKMVFNSITFKMFFNQTNKKSSKEIVKKDKRKRKKKRTNLSKI